MEHTGEGTVTPEECIRAAEEYIRTAADDPERRAESEKSLRKQFKKSIMRKFVHAVSDYELIQPGDRIAVCISGGKDSMLMAKCFQELSRRNKIPFETVFLCMNPGYTDVTMGMIKGNAKILGIPLTIFNSQIFDAVDTVEKSPCYLCARMRRGHLYAKAKELGCNKIALGHHFDDVIETTLMSILFSGQTQTMMPKLCSTNFDGMELIRPMYLIREKEIIHWRDCNRLQFIRCACHFTEQYTNSGNRTATGDTLSKRLETKELIRALAKTNPNVENNIFRSMENIRLNAVLGWKYDGEKHSFLDRY
jgi:tRNA 2-thiocytidine biosynthesis protein TtcA